MRKYDENISDSSLWITATPAPFAKALPFYVSETGHFAADYNYKIQRETHDSFLLIYTLCGQGFLQTGSTAVQLPEGHCAVIDCHTPHEYHSVSEKWDFLWIHFNGSGVRPLLDIAYPSGNTHAVSIKRAEDFKSMINALISDTAKNDISAYLRLSSYMHSILNTVCLDAIDVRKSGSERCGNDDIRAVVEYIEKNYINPITVDDMIRDIHVSKYHFIRRFSRAMGITPYSYLTNYRINMSKMLLRSTSKTVSEIAGECGFLDTSNFITHFKKHTGQKPLQYRRDFS